MADLTRAEVVERGACAIWTRYTGSKICKEDHRDISWETLVRWGQQRPLIQDLVDTARQEAADALDALLSLLAERGWQVVPVVATEEMYSVEHSPLFVLGAAGNTRVQQWRSGIFRAMCAPAPAPLAEETPHAR